MLVLGLQDGVDLLGHGSRAPGQSPRDLAVQAAGGSRGEDLVVAQVVPVNGDPDAGASRHLVEIAQAELAGEAGAGDKDVPAQAEGVGALGDRGDRECDVMLWHIGVGVGVGVIR